MKKYELPACRISLDVGSCNLRCVLSLRILWRNDQFLCQLNHLLIFFSNSKYLSFYVRIPSHSSSQSKCGGIVSICFNLQNKISESKVHSTLDSYMTLVVKLDLHGDELQPCSNIKMKFFPSKIFTWNSFTKIFRAKGKRQYAERIEEINSTSIKFW